MEKLMISEILDSIRGLTVKELLELTKAIKAIREITGLGLREAKEFVEAAPKIIKDGVSIEEAEALKAKFEELGAAITLK